MEEQIAELQQKVARLEERSENLTLALKENTQAITNLTASLNKSKGALWVIGIAGGCVTLIFNTLLWIKQHVV